MAGGGRKLLSEVKAGDAVVTVDPATHQSKAVTVKALAVHAAKNYALTRLVLLSVVEQGGRGGTEPGGHDVLLSGRVLEATPNHPMAGGKTAGQLAVGDKVLCAEGNGYKTFIVWDKTESAGGVQQVYNIVAGGGSTLILNGVMVMQK